MATTDRFLVGHAATFNSTTTITFEGEPFTETIAPGAFDFALGEWRLGRQATFNRDHDVGRLLGRNGKNLTLNEDGTGLHFKLRVPNTELGTDTFELVSEGVLAGMSFAARVIDEEWYAPEKRGELPHRVITKVSRLLDVSCCTWPAYDTPSIEVATRSEAEKSVRRLPEGYKPSRLGRSPKGYRRTIRPAFAKKMPGFTRRGCGHATEIGSASEGLGKETSRSLNRSEPHITNRT